MARSGPVSGGLLARDCATTSPPRLATIGVSHAQGVCIDRATTGGALPRGTPTALALPLAMWTAYERGAPTGHATQQAQRANVAIVAPALVLPDGLEHLSHQAALLGLTSLAPQHIGNQQALVVQPHPGLPREGAAHVRRHALRWGSVADK